MTSHKSTPIQLPLAIDGLTVELPLTKGYTALIDAVDADLLQYKWQANVRKNGRLYPHRNQMVSCKTYKYYLHKVILERKLGRPQKTGELCDHRDNNTLNCRRDNLRVTDKHGNGCNRGRQKNNTSGYKGVSFEKQAGTWRAQIWNNNVYHNLGSYESPELAYEAYCKAAREMFGEFARLE